MLELQATNLMSTDSEQRVWFLSDADLVLGKLSNNIDIAKVHIAKFD